MHWVSNVVVLLLVLGAVWAGRAVAGSRYWRESAAELWRRRRAAIVVVAVFVFVALLDSDLVGRRAAMGRCSLSAEDRSSTASSSPTPSGRRATRRPSPASRFYGSKPLIHPGAHLLGTDILGRDVVYRALKGVRVALLIGVFTSLIVIPVALLFGVSAGYFGRRIDDGVFFIMTVLASVPSLLLLIALIMVLGKGTLQVCIALGVTGWVQLLPPRARRDAEAARGRLCGRRRARSACPSFAHHHAPHPAQPRAPRHHHLRAHVHRPGADRDHPVLPRHRHRRQLGSDDRSGPQRAVARRPSSGGTSPPRPCCCSRWCSLSTSSPMPCATSPIRARARRLNERRPQRTSAGGRQPRHLVPGRGRACARGRSRGAADRAGRDAGAGGRIRAAASPSPRWPSCAWCRGPAASSRRAASRFDGPRPAVAAGAGDARACAAARSA